MAESVAALTKATAVSSSDRPMYEYTIPQSVRDSSESGVTVPKTVCLKVLTANEELIAGRIGKFDLLKSQFESMKRAICVIDGNIVSDADGTVSKVWETWPPKVRSLLIQAHNKLSAPDDEETESFLASMQVLVG